METFITFFSFITGPNNNERLRQNDEAVVKGVME